MIVFDLRCAGAHVFEAWFGSTADYDSQRSRSMIACPLCGDTGIDKAVMAPAVAAKSNRRESGRSTTGRENANEAALATPEALLPALLAMQRRMEAQSDYVGGNFATEARAMHEGTTPERSIYGEASAADVRALADDGVPVLPLPFCPLVRSDA